MPFSLPKLPFGMNDLSPLMSAETLEFHYGRHHKKYVETLNKMIEGTSLAEKSIEDLILDSQGPIFNNAAQAWNHTFFWDSLSPQGRGGQPSAELEAAFTKDQESFGAFKKQFEHKGLELFGSGYVWLAKDADHKLIVMSTKDADLPQRAGLMPLFCCDVWEHAYYIDYRNERPKFLASLWDFVNWNNVNTRFAQKEAVDLNPLFH